MESLTFSKPFGLGSNGHLSLIMLLPLTSSHLTKYLPVGKEPPQGRLLLPTGNMMLTASFFAGVFPLA